MDVASPVERWEFDSVYRTLAPLSYGIACRIAQVEQLAEKILTGAFIVLSNSGKLRGAGVKEMMSATFASAYTVLTGVWPVEEVRQRIKEEQRRIAEAYRSTIPSVSCLSFFSESDLH